MLPFGYSWLQQKLYPLKGYQLSPIWPENLDFQPANHPFASLGLILLCAFEWIIGCKHREAPRIGRCCIAPVYIGYRCERPDYVHIF